MTVVMATTTTTMTKTAVTRTVFSVVFVVVDISIRTWFVGPIIDIALMPFMPTVPWNIGVLLLVLLVVHAKIAFNVRFVLANICK